MDFGVEIRTDAQLTALLVASSADLQKSRTVDAEVFGTRHRSMARFTSANPNSLGFVVSQDGDIRAITRVGNRTVLFENVKVHSLWGDDLPKRIRAMHLKDGRKRKKKKRKESPLGRSGSQTSDI